VREDPDQSVLLRLEREGRRPPRVHLRGGEAGPATDRCGRYDVLGALARGSVGEILRGRDVDIGRDVALKVLREDRAGDREQAQRFVDEAQIAGQLQHPGVVPVYDLGLRADGRPFIAMKLVKGRTLAALLQDSCVRRHRRLQIFEQVCRTLAYAHERGVVHGDLKPSNIMVGSFGEVQVLDWGSAHILPRGGVADERLHEVGGDLHERADVLALGAILRHILTGEPEGELEACEAEGALVGLARRCLAARPADRPRNAGEIGDAVLAHLGAVEARAHEAALSAAKAAEASEQARAQAAHQRRARRQTTVLASVVLLALVLGGTSYVLLQGQERERRIRAAQAVTAALSEAQQHRGAGAWAPARAAAQKALTLAQDATQDLRERARATRAAIEVEATAAAARAMRKASEQAFLAEIEEGRLAFNEDKQRPWAERESERAAPFVSRGIDVDDPERAVAVIERDWAGIRVELAAAFDAWAGVRRKGERPWEPLQAIAARTDPDPWRMRLREAAMAADADALLALQREALAAEDLPVKTID